MAAQIPTLDEIEAVVRRVLREERGRAHASDVLSTSQAAAVAGVTRKTVNTWISEGRLVAGRRGRARTVRREDLDRFLEGERPRGPVTARELVDGASRGP
jgi:excisionase family DNA binding protein